MASLRSERSAKRAWASASMRPSTESARRSCSECRVCASLSRCLARRPSSRLLPSKSAMLLACSLRSCSMPLLSTPRTSRRPAARCSDSCTTSSCSSRSACHTGSLSWRPEAGWPWRPSLAPAPESSASRRRSCAASRCSWESMLLLALLIACPRSDVRRSWPSSMSLICLRPACAASTTSSTPRARRSCASRPEPVAFAEASRPLPRAAWSSSTPPSRSTSWLRSRAISRRLMVRSSASSTCCSSLRVETRCFLCRFSCSRPSAMASSSDRRSSAISACRAPSRAATRAATTRPAGPTT
mmetsp:Transcript_7709/g.24554  ORF Transcript_7709/g.24554 Transcript_7709/m.24554 type:complete len:300 (+) Transcript_7709:687-1586(+)